ncbi:phage holin family protein [Bifidobacterium phasiani]|uniref:Phage holin family protein n=1 Tax=Bifidobacterium phasiani TaxID=2834431 RepID=A0ABS6WBD3_9BIFI|nr:phage holin family protein [Bifidobacterium phasiani]MBW3083805.1 phage holin family protein [Bifidobacterium phasiani]
MQKTEIAALVIVAIIILLDWVTGLLKAAMQHDISSTKMREGLYHKSAFILVMFLAEIIEHAQGVIDLGFTVPIVVPAAVYITVTEVSSVIENLGEINPELQNSRLLNLFRSDKEPEAE